MTSPFLPAIDHDGVSAMRFTYCHPQPLFFFQHGNEMDMNWHQTITPNRDVELLAPLGHQGQVSLIVFIAEKSLHPPIPTLSHVVRNSGSYYTGDSWHGKYVAAMDGLCKGRNTYGVPLFTGLKKYVNRNCAKPTNAAPLGQVEHLDRHFFFWVA